MGSTGIREAYSSIVEKDWSIEGDKKDLAQLLRHSALQLFRNNPSVYEQSQAVVTEAAQRILDRRNWKIGSQPIGQEISSVDVIWSEFNCDENMWGDFASFVVVYPPILDQDGEVAMLGLLKVRTLR